jgi:anti-sigma factor RsiW
MTSGAHLTQDQLIEHLYCATERAAQHLAACPRCNARFLEIERRHAKFTAQPDLATEYFQRQRRAIQRRIGDTPPASLWGSIWVPVGLAVVLAAGLVIGRTYGPVPETLRPSIEETAEFLEILEPGWFAETYTAMQVAEPRAASPIVNLFAQPPVVE